MLSTARISRRKGGSLSAYRLHLYEVRIGGANYSPLNRVLRAAFCASETSFADGEDGTAAALPLRQEGGERSFLATCAFLA